MNILRKLRGNSNSNNNRNSSYSEVSNSTTEGDKEGRLPSSEYSCNNPSHINQNNVPDTGSSGFECNICFDNLNEPIITQCGHLYCWSCFYSWMKRRGASVTCPVCNSGVDKDKIIPVYARGGNGIRENESSSTATPSTTIGSTDGSYVDVASEESIPNRPSQVRIEPASRTRSNNALLNILFDRGININYEQVGYLELSMAFLPGFSMSFRFPSEFTLNHEVLNNLQREQQMISRFLLLIGLMVVFFILFIFPYFWM